MKDIIMCIISIIVFGVLMVIWTKVNFGGGW
jgi:hypothetical protein